MGMIRPLGALVAAATVLGVLATGCARHDAGSPTPEPGGLLAGGGAAQNGAAQDGAVQNGAGQDGAGQNGIPGGWMGGAPGGASGGGAGGSDQLAGVEPPGAVLPGDLLTAGHLSGTISDAFFAVEEITEAVFARMDGRSWRAGAIPISELRYLRVLHWGFGGGTYVGELVVNAAVAEPLLAVMRELYSARYEIERMVLVDEYDADDEASMRANNTSAFNHRYIAGTTRLSKHAQGLAIDLNPVQNPWVRGNSVQPENGRPYVAREPPGPHMINESDLAHQLLTAHGFTWGGAWQDPRDYQHFEH